MTAAHPDPQTPQPGLEPGPSKTLRVAAVGDLLADALGIAAALAAWAVWRGFRPRTAFQTSKTR